MRETVDDAAGEETTRVRPGLVHRFTDQGVAPVDCGDRGEAAKSVNETLTAQRGPSRYAREMPDLHVTVLRRR